MWVWWFCPKVHSVPLQYAWNLSGHNWSTIVMPHLNVIYMNCLSFSIVLHYIDTFILHRLLRVISEELSWVCCQCCKIVDSQVTRKVAFVSTPEAIHLQLVCGWFQSSCHLAVKRCTQKLGYIFLGNNNYCHLWTQSGKNHLQKYTGVTP